MTNYAKLREQNAKLVTSLQSLVHGWNAQPNQDAGEDRQKWDAEYNDAVTRAKSLLDIKPAVTKQLETNNAEEIDGLLPLKQPQLTDTELDVLSEHHMGSRNSVFCTGCGAEWPCFERQAIDELRERRQAMSMCADAEAYIAELREQVWQDTIDAATIAALYAERDSFREQNGVMTEEAGRYERLYEAEREQNADLGAGMAEFRQQLRAALFPFWPNNMGVSGDEIVAAVRRAVEQGESYYEPHQVYEVTVR